MGSINIIDDFQQYSGFIVKIAMKDGSGPLIGWLSEPRRFIPQGGHSNGKYSNATLYLIENWEDFSLENHIDGSEVLLSTEDVESIEILRRA
jgi:hypothetical protein